MPAPTVPLSGHVFIAASLDGFIARENDDISWLDDYSGSGEDHGYDAFIARMDGIVMGRGTFESSLKFDRWPHDLPVVVLSRTLDTDAIPEALREKVRISSLPPRDLADEMTTRGWHHAYVDGGKTIQSFLREGLIADMVVSRIPILLGAGRPLFGTADQDIRLQHLETRSFASGLVQSRYEVGLD